MLLVVNKHQETLKCALSQAIAPSRIQRFPWLVKVVQEGPAWTASCCMSAWTQRKDQGGGRGNAFFTFKNALPHILSAPNLIGSWSQDPIYARALSAALTSLLGCWLKTRSPRQDWNPNNT